jgi:hypothetical protein
MQVQCKGSGRKAGGSLNAKRAVCPVCTSLEDVQSNGNIRKHMRTVTKAQLRKLK